MRHIYITGTDTDAGKTRVSAVVAKALCASGERTTIVKLAQTGLPEGVPGDAHAAAALAECQALELHRFPKPADPWTAARAAGVAPLQAEEIAQTLSRLPGSLVVEGSGGVAVPLNARESISDVAARRELETILVVGLRLGCINHALLSLEYLRKRNMNVLGAVLCETRPGNEADYPHDVRHILREHCRILDTLLFENDPRTCVEQASLRFSFLADAGNHQGGR